MNIDEKYMCRCLELAQKATGNTYPNPMVGCVIVHEDRIIGEGFHERAGLPHAEINAIRSVKEVHLLPHSTIYVSLEPCAHYGKTPPCANAIVASGIKRAVIGCLDAHAKVNGKGKEILENAGIKVSTGILEQECLDLNRRFFTFHEKKRPYIFLKWARSVDGFIDQDYRATAISNSMAKQWVHAFRSREHAIMVGTKTALTDNPTLTTREVFGRNPIRIVIDLDLKIPTNYNIYNNEAQTIVFNTIKEDEGQVTFIKVNREDLLSELLNHLHRLQIQSLIVEGGAETLRQFIANDLWDEAIVITNPALRLENGTPAPQFDQTPYLIQKLRDNEIQFYKNDRS